MNSTVIAFLVIIVGSISAGISTGAIALYLGNESLNGVRSPKENPSQKLVKNNEDSGNQQEFTLMNERDILVKIYDLKHAHREKNK